MRSIRCSILVIATVATTMPARSAGFFEEVGRALFGAAKIDGTRASKPLVVHVRKRAQNRMHHNVQRIAIKRHSRVPVLNHPVRVDPYIDRDWFLKDETLRNGDIVVTANGPLVMQATRQTGSASDFISLSDARSLNQSEKHRLIEAIERGLQHRLSYKIPSGPNLAPDPVTGP